MPREGEARLEVFNVLGQRVSNLVDGTLPAGEHAITFSPRGLPPGLYYARLMFEGVPDVRRMLILK